MSRPDQTPQSTPESIENFADRLARRVDASRTPACVGIDPVLEQLPSELHSAHAHPAAAIAAFSRGVLDNVAEIVPVVKPQAACFERYGSAGIDALHATCEHAKRLGLIVILDAKRGDIGVTNRHYAASAFDDVNSDALTVSPYLGVTGLNEFRRPGRGLFVLVRTSNPEGDELQSMLLASGHTVAEHVAGLVAKWGGAPEHMGASGLSSIGAVVGATKAAEAVNLRHAMPNQIFLVPGFGAQGGTIEDVRRLGRPSAQSAGKAGVLVNASRSVLYPASGVGQPWQKRIADAARIFADELRPLFE